MTTRRSLLLLLSSVGTATVLAACSSGEGEAGSTSSASAESSASSASSGTAASAAPSSTGSQAASAPATAQPDASSFPVTVTDGNGEITIESLPEKVVVLDLTTLDTLVALGVSDRVVGVVANGDTLPTDLGDYVDLSSVEVVGSLQEPDTEAIQGLDPDLVIVGGRSSDSYEQVSASFTTLLIPGERDTSFSERLSGSTELLGQVFGLSDQATRLMDDYQKKVDEVKAVGSTVGTGLVLMTTGGEVSAFGTGSRFGLIHDDLGVRPAIEDVEAQTHGESISFELIGEANPDWLFVIDRDAAIGQSGQSAEQVLDNELVTATTAWTKDQVVYLDGARWYIVGAGLHNAPAMVDEVGTAIGA